MVNRVSHKLILVKVFMVITFCNSVALGQTGGWIVTYTPSNQEGGFSSVSSSDFADEAAFQQQRRNRANIINRFEEYRIQVARFDQKLLISAHVVQNMSATQAQVSKYPYAYALYKRSLGLLKSLESISKSAAESVKLTRDIKVFQSQQEQIMNQAVDDYHKGQYVQELGDNKAQIILEEKMAFESERCLTQEEKKEYQDLKDKIKFAQNQIAKLHQNGQSIEVIKNQLDNDYHVIAQSVKSLAKITEKVLVVYSPNEKVEKVIVVTQKVFDTFVDEAIAEGKPPTEAVKRAFEEGYKELKKAEQDKKKTPDDKKIEKIKDIFKQAQTEYEDWQKLDKKRKAVMSKVDEVIGFTEDIIQRNQKLVDAAKAKGERLTQRCIDGYGKRLLP